MNFNDVISSAKQGNFDELLNKTKSYADKATKKSAQRLEVSRKKLELLDSKNKLSKAYESYGKLMYAKAQGEAVSDGDLKSAEASIELQKMRAEMLDDEISELKSFFTEGAPKRGEDNPQSVKADIEIAVVEPSEDD